MDWYYDIFNDDITVDYAPRYAEGPFETKEAAVDWSIKHKQELSNFFSEVDALYDKAFSSEENNSEEEEKEMTEEEWAQAMSKAVLDI